MKKTIIKAVAFVLIFCTLWLCSSALVVNVDPEGYAIVREFYEQRENSLDAVYIGSSNGFAFWNSTFAWNEYGITVFPYCCNANPFYSTKYIIEDVRKTQENAKFIVNLNMITDGEMQSIHMHNIIGCMPFSLTKLKMIDHLCDMGNYEMKDRAEFYFPLIRFHQAWPNLYFSSKVELKPKGYKGSVDTLINLNDSVDVTDLYFTPKNDVELSEEIVSSTESLLSYCDEENIDVVFVVVPQAKGDQQSTDRLSTFAKFVSDKGYTVLDFSENFDEKMNIDMTKDYYNGPHTNIHGSIKYTDYMSKYLIEKYGFEDKRGNEEYADWNNAFDSYMEVVSPYVLDFELDVSHRDFSLEEPEFEIKADGKNAILSVSSVEDAQGCFVYRKDGADSPWKNIGEIAVKGDTLEYVDKDLIKNVEYYYTVVPYKLKDNECYYGDFNYSGKLVTLK